MNEDLATHLQSLEEHLLQSEIRRNSEALSTLLADGFREFGSSGRVFTKSQILAELATESNRTFILTDFHCEPLADSIALVTYRSSRTADEEPPVEALRSSLWVHRDNRWQMLFHQGTKL